MSDRILTVRVARIARETPDILSFELTHPQGLPLPGYAAGAHIDVHLPGGFVRQYSLARASVQGSRSYLIGVKREAQGRGGSTALHERVREGDLLPVSAPRNNFPLRGEATRHLLLAGGIGLTPMLAMAQSLSAQGASFTLCVFARSREHLAFAASLGDPALQPFIRLHIDEDKVAERIDLHALLAAQAPGTHAYICGPGGFMAAVRDAATGCRWPEEQLHAEYFAAPAESAALTGRPFALRLTRRGIEVHVAADQSAVDALRAIGIDVPVSCEQGLCGTCVVAGEGQEAEHRDFCLTGAERRHKVALCCSRAKGDALAIAL